MRFIEGDSLIHSLMWPVVCQGVMLRAAVVPNRDASRLPLVVNHEFGFFEPVFEKIKDALSLLSVDTQDSFRKARVDKNTGSSRVGIGANDWVYDRLVSLDRCHERIISSRTQNVPEPGYLPGVLRLQSLEIGLHAW